MRISFFTKASIPRKGARGALRHFSGITSSCFGRLIFGVLLAFQLPVSAAEGNLVGGMRSDNMSTQRMVTGTVFGNGRPLEGVTVSINDGSSRSTLTDDQGGFRISIDANEVVLVFSYVGYVTKQISSMAGSILTVELLGSSNDLDEVVVVGYGTQKRTAITGSVSSVQGSTLTAAPVANVNNTLAGRLPGLVAVQSSGLPGSDASSLSIRGFGNALVIVDGAEADIRTLDANTIESITILKDGAAAIYGSRAGNGVVLVTTKRGATGKPIFNYSSAYSLQGITAMPRPASAGQYAEMVAETWLQSGQNPQNVPFTEDQILKFYAGTDPLYPNTDWYSELIKDWAPQSQHNLSLSGGSDALRFFGNLGYVNQHTFWKENGGEFSRYNLQANIDAKILDNLSLEVKLTANHEDRDFPQRGQQAGDNSVWADFWATLPIYPAKLPDPTRIPYAGTVAGIHALSNSEIAGYNNSDRLYLRVNTALEYRFKSVLEGLSARAFFDLSPRYFHSKNFVRPVQYYTYDPSSGIYNMAAALNSSASLTEGFERFRDFTYQLSLSYNRTIDDVHQISALFLNEVIDYQSSNFNAGRINYLTDAIDQLFAGSTSGMFNNGSASEMGRKSLVGRLNYSYRNRYLLESSLRADASAKFPDGKQWGYFPNVSLGWVVSEERFMRSMAALNHLKLRASYGNSGDDAIGNFQYLSGYRFGEPYLVGSTVYQTFAPRGLSNPLLTWEKITIGNLGLDFALWNRKLYGEFDAFYRERNGIPATRLNSLPSSFGAQLPPENINSLSNRGFESRLGTAGSFNGVSYDVSANLSWTRGRWIHFEEPEFTDADQIRISKRSGQWVDRQFGYLTSGLFTTQEEINNLEFDQDQQGNLTLRPGDVKFIDSNGDGVVDWKDQVEIGKSTSPNWMFGFNININYKRFDFSALFQGAFGHYAYVALHRQGNFPQLLYENRWTEQNNSADALFPRLGGTSANANVSDRNFRNGDYLRLKALSIGYNVLNQRFRINRLRVFIAGNNLLTFSGLNEFDIDPESPSGAGGYYYPQQRILTAGLNVSF